MSQPIKVFVSYSRRDKEYKEELLEFLAPMRRNNVIQIWNDKDIVPGEQWEDELLDRLTTADMVIFLLSPSLLNSDYIHRVEIKGAMERHKKGELIIIPILIRNSDFAESDFKTFQGLPCDLKPVSTWEDRDSAWLSVTKGLKRVIESIQKKIETKKASSSIQNNSANPPSNQNINTGDGIAVQNINSQGDVNININQNSSTSSPEVASNGLQIFDKARTAIVNTNTEDAIKILTDYTKTKDSQKYNSLLMLSSQLNGIKQEKILKTRREDDIDISINRINNALLSIISDLEKEVK